MSVIQVMTLIFNVLALGFSITTLILVNRINKLKK